MPVKANTILSFLEAPAKRLKEAESEEDDAELLYLLSEADDLRLQLAKQQEKITHLEASLEPLQLSRPTNASCTTWDAAGLGSTAELEEAILAIENWIFTQSNYESLTAAGWLTYLYEILEEPIRTACRGRRQLKIDLGTANETE